MIPLNKSSCNQSDYRNRGALLLETLIGVSLFFMTAMYVLTGLSSSLQAVSRTKMKSTAADLMVTVESEIQMGLHELVTTADQTFETGIEAQDYKLQGWTWSMIVEDPQDLPDAQNLKFVEITIKNTIEPYTLTKGRLMWFDPNAPTPDEVKEANEAAAAAEEAGGTTGTTPEIPGGLP